MKWARVIYHFHHTLPGECWGPCRARESFASQSARSRQEGRDVSAEDRIQGKLREQDLHLFDGGKGRVGSALEPLVTVETAHAKTPGGLFLGQAGLLSCNAFAVPAA